MSNAKIRPNNVLVHKKGGECEPSDYIGLFPAAGHARRLAEGPFAGLGSKEIAQVPDLQHAGNSIAVGDYLIREYRCAGIHDVIIIRRDEKQDIRTHYAAPAFGDLNVIDLVTEATPSTAHSIDKAWEWIKERPVALGFPDIIINPPGVFSALCQKMAKSKSDVCIGLFPALHPTQSDMVRLQNERVQQIEVKPAETLLKMTWSCAVWQPAFSRFLHESIARSSHSGELYIGRLFQIAIDAGLHISAVPFAQSLSLDIGTPDSFKQAQKL